MVYSLLVLLAMQPDPAALRRLFEENLTRTEKRYGAGDARTAEAARDLGLFLKGRAIWPAPARRWTVRCGQRKNSPTLPNSRR